MSAGGLGKVRRPEPDPWARAVLDHLAIKTATGPISGCQCGQLRLGESYTEHLRAALPPDHRDALAAVLELHKPHIVELNESFVWRICTECSDPESGMTVVYPCTTARLLGAEA